jgi:prepilin-type N-terminal cleavage/methylation domain-containing protein/prepilin-type processing-associated H-X9-DG protein
MYVAGPAMPVPATYDKSQGEKTMQKRQAFTLIELLVVIAVIALLLAIIVPALSMAKEMGRMVVCGTNEKSLVTAAKLWADDNKDHAIAGDWWKEPGSNETESSILPYLSTDRYRTKDSKTCPSATNVKFFGNNLEHITSGQEFTFTYASNGYMSFNFTNTSPGVIDGPDYYDQGSGREKGPNYMYWTVRGSTKISSIKRPYNIAHFIDNEYYFVQRWFFDPTKAPEEIQPNKEFWFQTRWHKKNSAETYGIGNIGWVDGHVSREPKDFAEVVEGTESARRWTVYFYGK